GNLSATGGGGIVKTLVGNPNTGFAFSFRYCANMEAESLALPEGICLCLDQDCIPALSETDSKILCNMIPGTATIPWTLHATISRAKHLMSLGSFHIVHVFREANTVVDALAKYASSSANLSLRVDHHTLSFIPGLIRLDCMRTPTIRLVA
ncbi:hypothetical protein ACH5RR_003185, partial [Cinchona calisaya]